METGKWLESNARFGHLDVCRTDERKVLIAFSKDVIMIS
jgi:hypothetical protein